MSMMFYLSFHGMVNAGRPKNKERWAPCEPHMMLAAPHNLFIRGFNHNEISDDWVCCQWFFHVSCISMVLCNWLSVMYCFMALVCFLSNAVLVVYAGRCKSVKNDFYFVPVDGNECTNCLYFSCFWAIPSFYSRILLAFTTKQPGISCSFSF